MERFTRSNGLAAGAGCRDGAKRWREVAGWAAAGVEWAVENGIMGVSTAFLNPGDDVTRAEAAAMTLRYDAVTDGFGPIAVG